MSDDSVKIIVRARPLLEKEIQASRCTSWKIDGNTIRPTDDSIPVSKELMTFDHIFDTNSTNKQLHETVTGQLVLSCLEGYNCTVFTYGQTSSGKRHTMEGSLEDSGIIPRVIEQIFRLAGKERKNRKYIIRIAYFKIHNEKIYDLLKYNTKEVKIQQAEEGGIMICAKEVVTSIKDQVLDLLRIGRRNRHLYAQRKNIKDSRSDTVFRIIVEHELKDGTDSMISISHLNLVTLSGSERISRPEGTEKFTDREYINRSLSVLSSIISQNIDKVTPMNYRETKLTLLLKNAFGGNAKVVIIANISLASLENTYFTLSFAHKAKCIRNKPTINIIGTTNSTLKQCLSQIQQLEEELRDVKEHCAELKAIAQAMQNIDILHERINLISKAFVKTETTADLAELEFHNILRVTGLNLSSLETRLLNVLHVNNAYNADSISKRNKLPFEMLFFNLSNEIGNEFIVQLPEKQEELTVIDYLVDPDGHHSESEVEFSEKEIDTQSMDISYEYSELEKSISSKITNEDLKIDLSNLTAIFTTNYTQQVAMNKSIEKQNQALLDEITELTKKLRSGDKQKEALQQKIKQLEIKMTTYGRQISSDLKKQYNQLLEEADKKDMEYFQVLKEKDTLEKTVKDLTAALGRCKTTISFPQPMQVTDKSVSELQSEIAILSQKLVDQEFIMNEMNSKHKRREEELLKRLNEKEGQKEKIFSAIIKTEKQIQTVPVVQDSTTQTKQPFNIDISLQTEEFIPQTGSSRFDTSKAEISKLAHTSEHSQIVDDSEIPEIGKLDLEHVNAIKESMLQLLSNANPGVTKAQQIIMQILEAAKEIFDTYHDKHKALWQLQNKDLSTNYSIKEASNCFLELIHCELQDVRMTIKKAHRASAGISVLQTQLQHFWSENKEDDQDITGQLGEQISVLRKQIFELEGQVEVEKRNTVIAQNESMATRYEMAKLKETVHRIIPSTTETQILQDVSESKAKVISLQRDVFRLNNDLKGTQSQITALLNDKEELINKTQSLQIDIETKVKIQETLLENQQGLETELVMTRSDLLSKVLELDALQESLQKLTKTEYDNEPAEGTSQASGEVMPDNIHIENHLLKRELARIKNLVKEQTIRIVQYQQNIIALENVLRERDLDYQQERIQERVSSNVENLLIEDLKKQYEEVIETLKKQNISLRNESEELQSKIPESSAMASEIISTRIEIDVLKKDLEISTNKLVNMEKQLLASYKQLSMKDGKILMLESNLSNYFRSESILEVDMINLLQKCDKKNALIGKLNKQQIKLKFENQYYQTKLSDIKKVLRTIINGCAKAKLASKFYWTKSLPNFPSTLTSVQDTVEDLTELRKGLTRTASVPNLNALVDEPSIGILSSKNANAKLTKINNELKYFENMLTVLDSSLTKVKNKYYAIKNEVDCIVTKNAELENNLRKALHDLIVMVRTLEEYKLEINSLLIIRKQLLASNQKHVENITTLRNEMNKLETTFETLTTKVIEEEITTQTEDYSAESQEMLIQKQDSLEFNTKEQEEYLELTAAEPECAESGEMNLAAKIKHIEMTLVEKTKIEKELQDQIVALKKSNEKISKCYRSELSTSTSEESVSFIATVQQLQSLKDSLEEELHERNALLLEQCKVFKKKSQSKDFNVMKGQLMQEINSYKQKCLSIMEQNCCLLQKVSDLELAYFRDISNHVECDPKIQEALRDKEEELAEIKGELRQVELKLSATNQELQKFKSRCICEVSTSSSSVESRRMEEAPSSDTPPCLTCDDLSEKIKELERKLAASQSLPPTKTSNETLEQYKSYIEAQKEELENLHMCNQELNRKYTLLQTDYDDLLRYTELSQEEPSAYASPSEVTPTASTSSDSHSDQRDLE